MNATRLARWLLLALPLGVGLADAVLGPPRVKPDMVRGGTIYRQACSSCHDQRSSRPDFRQRVWKLETSPQEVAAAALGAAGHPAVLGDAESAWHASAYLWTRSTSKAEVLRGLALAQDAEARLKSANFFVLLGRLGELNALRDPAWVLSHTPAQVDLRFAALSGEDYQDLSSTERVALSEYLYASYFAWPPGWEDEAEAP